MKKILTLSLTLFSLVAFSQQEQRHDIYGSPAVALMYRVVDAATTKLDYDLIAKTAPEVNKYQVCLAEALNGNVGDGTFCNDLIAKFYIDEIYCNYSAALVGPYVCHIRGLNGLPEVTIRGGAAQALYATVQAVGVSAEGAAGSRPIMIMDIDGTLVFSEFDGGGGVNLSAKFWREEN